MITTCLEKLTPGQSEKVLDSLAKSKFKGVDDSLHYTLLEALFQCYKNANHCATRKQVLSIMADKVSFSELKKWIPDISRYRFNIARHHQLLHGRGALPQNVKNTRMYVKPEKLEHFLTFITSTHIVQDSPFREKVLKLSIGSELKTQMWYDPLYRST